jgi:formylglycine-generating enzyme required for sulfatase activity
MNGQADPFVSNSHRGLVMQRCSSFMTGQQLFTIILSWLMLSQFVLAAEPAKKYALLIGVAKYDHAELNKPLLQYPEADATALAALLKEGGYQCETLLGKQATQAAIRQKLAALKQKAESDGVVLIGIFGHGVEIETREPQNAVALEGCFCPFDTILQQVKDVHGRPVFGNDKQPLIEPDPATLIKLSEIMTALKLAKAGNRVVLADCCRTIPNQARGRSFGAGFRAQDLPENTSVLFGCSPNEQAFEHADWGHGAFTKCLLDELRDLSARGAGVESAVLAAALKKKVPALVASVAPRYPQTPKLFSTDTVDLQLKLLASSRPTLPSNNQSTVPPTNPRPADKVPEGKTAGEQREFAGIKFRWCPPTDEQGFTMGTPGATDDEAPVKVVLTKGFWMGETEVTQGQWKTVLGTEPWKNQVLIKDGANYPAVNISHGLDADGEFERDSAMEFCQKLSTKEAKVFRLPTEAEWEYACRCGTATKYSFGDNESVLTEYCWYAKNTLHINNKHPHRVGLKKPNSFGLHDMHGNVWEWCSDWYGEKLIGGRDTAGNLRGEFRVLRGGGWGSSAVSCRSAFRNRVVPSDRLNMVGFRLVLAP